MAMRVKSFEGVSPEPHIFLHPKGLTKRPDLAVLLSTAIKARAHLDAQLGWSLDMLLVGTADLEHRRVHDGVSRPRDADACY